MNYRDDLQLTIEKFMVQSLGISYKVGIPKPKDDYVHVIPNHMKRD